MTNDSSYSIKEMISHVHEDISSRLDNIDKKQEDTATKTSELKNKFVQLETSLADYGDVKKLVAKHDNYVWWAIGLFTLIVSLGYFSIKWVAQETVTQALSGYK